MRIGVRIRVRIGIRIWIGQVLGVLQLGHGRGVRGQVDLLLGWVMMRGWVMLRQVIVVDLGG